MNKRIKELYQKAHKEVVEEDIYNGMPSVELQFAPEKFAELLVRMCADAADMYQEAGCEYVGDAVAEYMGYGTEEGVVEWRAKC